MNPPPPRKSDSFALAFGIYGAVGFQLAISVVGGLMLGSYLDRRFDLVPWLTLSGLILGAIGGFYNLIRVLQWNDQRKQSKDS